MHWSRTFGAKWAKSVIQTTDGGYVAAGINHTSGDYDLKLVKVDQFGGTTWNRTYGGTGNDFTESVIQTADGGYALVGFTDSYGAGSSDVWLVKTDQYGIAEWNYTYGGGESESASAVVQTVDGGYAIAGTRSEPGTADVWLVKTDNNGNHVWNKTYGGVNIDSGTSLIQATDGGYAIAGTTYSPDIEGDYWLIKTDNSGNEQWNRTYGNEGEEYATSMIQTSDSGFAIAGSSRPPPGGGMHDYWLVKTDDLGSELWNKTYRTGGQDGTDIAYSVIQTTDGGYAMAGYTNHDGAGGRDAWLVKTDSYGNEQWGLDRFKYGLAWVETDLNTITLYRGENDSYWTHVRVRIWKLKETP